MSETAYKVVLFDVGNTLLRTYRPVGQIYADMASHYGLKPDPEILQRGFVAAWKELKPREPEASARALDDRGWWKDLVRRAWGEIGLDAAFPFDAYFDELYSLFERPDVWRVFPEVELSLEALQKRGIRCGILSNWDRRLRKMIEGLELAPYFEHMIISSEVGAEKPSGKIFATALEKFGVKASEVLLIGDDPIMDGEGGRSCGMRVELVERPRRDVRIILEDLKLV